MADPSMRDTLDKDEYNWFMDQMKMLDARARLSSETVDQLPEMLKLKLQCVNANSVHANGEPLVVMVVKYMKDESTQV